MNCFFTLDELKQYQPKRDTYFVFGDPIGHSLSPQLHHSYFSLAHLDGDYLAVRVSQPELQEAIDCVKGYAKGINLTIPLKEAVIPILDEIDETAKAIGAVNTLTFAKGKVKGYNTDFYGIELALKAKGVDLTNARILILGNGGAAKAFLAVSKKYTSHITVAGRNLEKVAAFCKGTDATPALLSEVAGNFDVIFNATSMGMGAQISLSPLSVSQLQHARFLFDAIYNPVCTNFLTLGKMGDIDGVNGLPMLIYQGLKAQEIWGNPVDDSYADVIDSTLKSEFTNAKKNIVLIGYMGSGKTTIGKEISRQTGMPFYDMDELLEQLLGNKISDVFEQKGEAFFREKESELAKKIAHLHGCVISTGGGIIKNKENIPFLKENGTVFFLNPPYAEIEKRLTGDSTRPLLKNPKNLKQLYEERLSLYQAAADFIILKTDAKESAGEILEIFRA